MNDFITSLGRPDFPGAPDGSAILFMLALAFSIGILVGFIYMWTHEALAYSRTFVGALAMLPLIAAMESATQKEELRRVRQQLRDVLELLS